MSGGGGRDALYGGEGDDFISSREDLNDPERGSVSCGGGYDRVSAGEFDRIARDCEELRVAIP